MEEWRPVVGFESLYEISDRGRARSRDRTTQTLSGLRFYQGRLLKLNKDRNGYPVFTTCVDGVKRNIWVAVAVLAAFKGPPPVGMECCHGDGVKANCRLKNLRYDTRANNHADKLKHGTHNRGERNGGVKLTARAVKSIRSDRRSQRAIAGDFGVSQTLVSRIKLKKVWAHL